MTKIFQATSMAVALLGREEDEKQRRGQGVP
jgi:hypothetical protein